MLTPRLPHQLLGLRNVDAPLSNTSHKQIHARSLLMAPQRVLMKPHRVRLDDCSWEIQSDRDVGACRQPPSMWTLRLLCKYLSLGWPFSDIV